jgi:aspartate aminotransferase-like enzyme/GNAT superfamily N-acetyltransferase
MEYHNDFLVKKASEDWEFKQIHALNYQTFVEEIPQHEENERAELVDRFHHQNTYFIAVRNQEVIGMVSVCSERPFSLELKLPDLAQYVTLDSSVCEIRLLSIAKTYRKNRVLPKLLSAVYEHCKQHSYQRAIISAIAHQLKLYQRLGFTPFATFVGTKDALYQPMMLEMEDFENHASFLHSPMGKQRFPHKIKGNFLPGPVQVSENVYRALNHVAISHRASSFVADFQWVKQHLCKLTRATQVEILLGSGTLANDAIAAQLSLISGQGLILSNGEFGERLLDHAHRFKLQHQKLQIAWGEPFDPHQIIEMMEKTSDITWLWAAHCETSTGILNDISFFQRICAERSISLCLDCISSIGTIPVDLSRVYFASCTSGKGLRSFPGLSMVFYHHPLFPSSHLPRYLDLGIYREREGIPYTHSSNLIYALKQALQNSQKSPHAQEIADLSNWLKATLQQKGFQIVGLDHSLSPAVITLMLPLSVNSKETGDRLKQDGFWLQYETPYLIKRNWLQICLMGNHKPYLLEQLVQRLETHVH